MPLMEAVGRTPPQDAVVVVVVVVMAAECAESNWSGFMPAGFTPAFECGDGWPDEDEGSRECAPDAVLVLLVVLVPVCSCAGTITLPNWWCSLVRELVADAEAEADTPDVVAEAEAEAEADESSGGGDGDVDSLSSSNSKLTGAVSESESAVGSRVASVQCTASVR